MDPIVRLDTATMNAFDELQGKTIEQVQTDTAFAWGGRALAAFENFRRTGLLQWLMDGEEYLHEALEHAALVSDPSVLDSIRPPLAHACAAAKATLIVAKPSLG